MVPVMPTIRAYDKSVTGSILGSFSVIINRLKLKCYSKNFNTIFIKEFKIKIFTVEFPCLLN